MSARLVRDLPEAEYHAATDSLSVSGAKILVSDGPAAFRWRQDHREHKDAFDIGHAAHKLVLGVGDPLVVIEANDWRTKAAQEARDAARAEGAVPLLAKDHALVQAMADRLSSHTTAMQLLSHGEPEVSAYAPDEATGVLRRGRVDWLHPRVLVDYKTTAGSVHPTALAGKYGTVSKWGYAMQAAWYTDLLRDNGHPAEHFAFIFQSKTAPYDITVGLVPDDQLWEAREKNAEALRIFAHCTETGIWPGPVADDEWAVLSLNLPTYELERVA